MVGSARTSQESAPTALIEPASTSYSPALRKHVDIGRRQYATAASAFEGSKCLLEVRVTMQEFPGESGSIEGT
jgi:hypothetical protein